MTPKKILLMAHDVTLAHLGRPLRLAEGLIADGHDVTLAASAESSRFLKNFPARVHTLAPTGKARFIDNLAKGRPVFDFETLKCFAEEDEALLASLRPDLVIGDFRLSLSVSARRARIPYATITNAYWSPAFTPRFVVPDLPMVRFLGVGISQFLFDLARPFAFAYHARPMNALRRHYGMPSLGHDLRRIYTDADLALFSDVPQIYGLPDGDLPGSVFLGPIGWSPDVPLPAWWGSLDPRRPLVYVTLGSSGDKSLLPNLVHQLLELDAELVVATAGETTLPRHPKLHSADYLPGEQIASRASLVVCNGGSPTAFQAIAKGVPVLGIPGNLDQYLNMHYLEKCHLGITLRNQGIKNDKILSAAQQMLKNASYADTARSFAEIISRYTPRSRLAEAIAKLSPC